MKDKKKRLDFSNAKFYKELASLLPASTGEQRRMWASSIIEKDIDIKYLSKLFKSEHKTTSRFLWLLSDVGIQKPNKLLTNLPFLLEACSQLNPLYTTAFASYWCYVGVPTQNEAIAIHLLFQWLVSPDTNVTTKSRSILVLFELTKKYPELKNELILCLVDQKDKHSHDFSKRTNKIILKLEKD